MFLIPLVKVVIAFMLFSFSEILAYSNLEELNKLVVLQEKQLSNPLDSSTGKEIKSYNKCVKMLQDMRQTFNIFSPRYFFGVQDFQNELECLCIPHERPMKWTKITFANVVNIVAQRDGRNSILILEKVKPELSIYYCSWKFEDIDIINNIWLVEIVASNNLEKVRAISWKDPEPYISPDVHISVSTKWEKWSMCNKCDKAGKRHRFGYCSVEKREATELPILNTIGNISCSALLSYEPDIAPIDENLTKDLMIAPKVMVGYCKVSCKFYGNDFEKAVSPDVRLMYKDSYPIRDSENRGYTGNTEELLFSNYSWFSKVPDIILLFLFLGLLLWIIILITVNRKQAQ